MKILLFGGNGKASRELINQALGQGHSVTSLARNPEKPNISNPGLNDIKGNVLDL